MKLSKEVFIILSGAAFLAASVLSLTQDQLTISLWINQNHLRLFDYVCYFTTHLGDGVFAVLLGIAVLYFRRHLGILLLLCYALSSGLTQALKRLVFADVHRPLWHLERLNEAMYYVPPGVEHIYNHSFPSGHTTAAFAIFGMLSFATEKLGLKVAYFLLAVLVAFSRIYLLQHFLIDTMFGALIGTFVSYFIYFNLYQKSKIDFLLNLKHTK